MLYHDTPVFAIGPGIKQKEKGKKTFIMYKCLSASPRRTRNIHQTRLVSKPPTTTATADFRIRSRTCALNAVVPRLVLIRGLVMSCGCQRYYIEYAYRLRRNMITSRCMAQKALGKYHWFLAVYNSSSSSIFVSMVGILPSEWPRSFWAPIKA